MRTLRPLLALVSLGLLFTGGAAPASAGSPPQLIEVSPAGWVVVRKPGVASYQPDAKDRGNTSGGAVTVTHPDTGQWNITFAGLAAPAGSILQATALGAKSRHCLAWTWNNGGNASIDVYCYKRVDDPLNDNAAPIDTPFVATYTGMLGDVTGLPGRVAYAWVGNAAADSTPDLTYNQISTGGVINVTHDGTGRYTVVQPGIGKDDGTPLVTEYVGTPGRCQIRSWVMTGATLRTKVDCFDLTGTAADNNFDYLYTRHVPVTAFASGHKGASFLADQPTATSYHPVAGLAWSSAGKQATITRTSKGVYVVKLPGMPAGGAALVTAFGKPATPRNCQIGSIRTSGTPQQVTVRCFTYAGKPADSRFTFSYTR